VAELPNLTLRANGLSDAVCQREADVVCCGGVESRPWWPAWIRSSKSPRSAASESKETAMMPDELLGRYRHLRAIRTRHHSAALKFLARRPPAWSTTDA
jgi:hypothetical protein